MIFQLTLNLAKTILRLGEHLEALDILVEHRQIEWEAMALTIKYLVSELYLLKYLKKLTISLPLTDSNVRILAEAVGRCKALTDLTIYVTELHSRMALIIWLLLH